MEQKIIQKEPGSEASLSIGFVLCLFLTVIGYGVVQTESLPSQVKIVVIACLAFIQFIAQMFFFLHLGHERKPRYKLWMFFGMASVVGILVIGSLWIMHNLDYNMMNMTEQEKNQYMDDNQGI